MTELHRVCNRKFIVIILLSLLFNVFTFIHFQLDGNSIGQFQLHIHQYQALVKAYKDMKPEEAAENLATKMEDITELKDDRELWFPVRKELKGKLEYINGYHDGIQNILDNAECMKKRSLFAEKDTYAYKNILRTEEDFSRVSSVELQLCNDKAVKAFLNYSAVSYFIFGIMLFVIFQMSSESETGLKALVRSTVNGRMGLALKRIGIMALLLFIVELIIFTVNLLVSVFIYGSDSLFQNIQTIQEYADFTYEWSQLQYILFYFLIIYVAMFAVCMLVWMIYTVFERKNIVTFLLAIVFGVELFLFQNIDIHGQFRLLKNINIFRLFYINDLCRKYENCDVLFGVMSVSCVVIVCAVFLVVLSCVIICAVYIYRKTYGGKNALSKIIEKFSEMYQKALQKYPFWAKELHKVVITSKGYFIVLGVILLLVYCNYITYRPYTSLDKEQIALYNEEGGQDYSTIRQEVESKKKDYIDSLTEAQSALSQYNEGEIEFKTYYDIYNKMEHYRNLYTRISVMSEKIQYIDSMKENYGIEVWMIPDVGYDFMFGPNSYERELVTAFIMSAGVFLLIINCMFMEKTYGMQQLLYAYPNGRKWFMKRKIYVCLGTAVIFGVIIVIGQLLWLGYLYGFHFLKAPLYSISFMNANMFSVFGGLTVAGWLVVYYVLRVIMSGLVAGVAIIFSSIWAHKKSTAGIPIVLLALLLMVWIIVKLSYHCAYIV